MGARGPVVNIDGVAARAGNDLTRVELEGCHWVLILEDIRDGTRAKVPDLEINAVRSVGVATGKKRDKKT